MWMAILAFTFSVAICLAMIALLLQPAAPGGKAD
jgi:hypothetical protein